MVSMSLKKTKILYSTNAQVIFFLLLCSSSSLEIERYRQISNSNISFGMCLWHYLADALTYREVWGGELDAVAYGVGGPAIAAGTFGVVDFDQLCRTDGGKTSSKTASGSRRRSQVSWRAGDVDGLPTQPFLAPCFKRPIPSAPSPCIQSRYEKQAHAPNYKQKWESCLPESQQAIVSRKTVTPHRGRPPVCRTAERGIMAKYRAKRPGVQ